MATKDPFANVPPLQPDTPAVQSATPAQSEPAPTDFVESSKQGSKGKPPKNLTKHFASIVLPIACIGLLVWVFMPEDNKESKRPPETPETVVDRAVQTSKTNDLLDSLKADANKAPDAPPQGKAGAGATANNTGMQGANPAGAPAGYGEPNSPGYNPYPQPMQGGAQANNAGGNVDPKQAAEEAKRKRAEEVSASPIEAPGNFVLLAEKDTASPKSSAGSLQEEIARMELQKNAAVGNMQADTNSMLASLTRQPTASSQGSGNTSRDFLNSQAASAGAPTYATLQQAPSPYMLHENTVIRAQLKTNVSSDMPGKIEAQVTSDVHDTITHKYLLIPKGSRLIGVYNNQVAVGQEMLLIAMTRLILPNGSSITLGGAPAGNMVGRSGIDAKVNNHFWKMFSSSFVIGASSMLLGDRNTSVQTNNTAAGSTTTGSVAGMALNDVVQTLLQRNKNIQPTLSRDFGVQFTFLVANDMVMQPYIR